VQVPPCAGRKAQPPIDELLLATDMPLEIPPRGASHGFVFTHLDEDRDYLLRDLAMSG